MKALQRRNYSFDTRSVLLFAVLTLEGSVNARNHIGGTAPAQVKAAVTRGKALLANR